MKPYEIVVDVKNLNTFQDNTVSAKQGDIGREVIATITDNGVPVNLTGRSVIFFVEKKDNQTIFNDTEITDAEQGQVKFKLTTQVLVVPKILEAELLINDANENKISSALFNINVKRSINDPGAVESTNEFTALDSAINSINIYRNEMNNLESNYSPKLQGLEEQFNDVVANVTIDSEVIAARTSTVTGKAYDSLNLRLDDIEEDSNEIKSRIPVKKLKTDIGEHPGSWYLAKGSVDNGFYGFVRPEDMGTFESGKEYNGANLALEIGLSAGVAFNSNVPLMKFSRGGKVLFEPLTGYRYSLPWDPIYNAGAVYGTNDDGFLPPAGRAGTQLSIVAGNTIKTTKGDFLGDKSAADDYADTVGAVGDTLVLKDWPNKDNNKEVTITAITNDEIVVDETLIPEAGAKKSRLYNKKNVVRQNKTVTIGGKQYRVRLMKGAGTNPTDSYTDADRGAIGPDNEWNDLILPLHEHAKIGNWIYPAYAKNSEGAAIEDWGVGLTDEDLRTHHTFGAGSYTWCQENQNDTTYRRVSHGGLGASYLHSHYSWYTNSALCFRPVLEAI